MRLTHFRRMVRDQYSIYAGRNRYSYRNTHRELLRRSDGVSQRDHHRRWDECLDGPLDGRFWVANCWEFERAEHGHSDQLSHFGIEHFQYLDFRAVLANEHLWFQSSG